MEDKVKEVIEEFGEGVITFKNGQKSVVPTKTTYTIWDSGRKDCNVQIQKPIDATPTADLK